MHDGAVIPSPDGDRRAVVVPGPDRCELRTARLRLTPVAEHELDELLALHADPRAFAEDLTEPLTDRAQMRWVLRRWRETWADHGLGYLSVRAREAPGEDGAREGAAALPTGLLGVVGLSPLTVADRTVLSAYWRLSPAATGHGVASEAMRAVLAHPRLGGRGRDGGRAGHDGGRGGNGREHERGGGDGGPEIIAVTAAGNGPSRALAARLGFAPAPPDRPVPGGRKGDVLLVHRDS